jgi:osmotically inducible protein OsmC
MATRTAKAEWKGTLKEGAGTMALGSGAFEGAYDFKSRFEGSGGANPEELIAAAQAGCFSMQLSANLEEAGNTPESIQTDAKVSLRMGEDGPYIARIVLTTRGRVPGIDEAAFREAAEDAKDNCIVSKVLDVPTELELTLES